MKYAHEYTRTPHSAFISCISSEDFRVT